MFSFREPVSGLTHLFGAALALAGAAWLIAMTSDDLPKMLSVGVFGLTMVAVYLASAALHLYDGHPDTIARLTRLDHAAIYLYIAGAYTVFGYNLMDGQLRWILLVLIWTLALIGAVGKLWRFRSGHQSTLQYVLMGWLALFAVPSVIKSGQKDVVALVAAGGIVYTLGALIFALEKPNFSRHIGFHEIWHVFVMIGSALHFAAVVWFVV